jgi:hypothetical protein
MAEAEEAKKSVELKGREARNVRSWRVPNEVETASSSSRPPSTAEGSVATGRGSASLASGGSTSGSTSKSRAAGSSSSQRRTAAPSPPSGAAAATAGGKEDEGSRIRRFFSLLFRNLNRAVDELYFVCEAESSLEHSEEAARLLESCKRDFTKVRAWAWALARGAGGRWAQITIVRINLSACTHSWWTASRRSAATRRPSRSRSNSNSAPRAG